MASPTRTGGAQRRGAEAARQPFLGRGSAASVGRDRRPVEDSYVVTQGTLLSVSWGNNLIADTHRTQVSVHTGSTPVAYAMSNGVAQPLLDVEEFMLVEDAAGPNERADTDLFAGVDP